MAKHGRSHETEIKLKVGGASQARRLLREAGFKLAKRRVFESNVLFDQPNRKLARGGSMLRVRTVGDKGLFTYKGLAIEGKHKSREELEIEVADPAQLVLMLERLHFRATIRYEKFRTEYQRSGERGEALVDETPIGAYLELEGAPSWIDRTARRLGFKEKDYITASYYALYVDFCRARGVRPGNMTFDSVRASL